MAKKYKKKYKQLKKCYKFLDLFHDKTLFSIGDEMIIPHFPRIHNPHRQIHP